MSLLTHALYSYCQKISVAIGCLFIVFQVSAQPATIAGFSPSSGKPRDTITISGQNFKDMLAVKFGGVRAATFINVNLTTIKAVVGAGATGAVEVTTLTGGTASLAGFTFTGPPPPSITSFAPVIGYAGTEVVIKGINFSGEASRNIVLFGVAKATVTKASETELTVLAPPGATASPVSVTVNDFTAHAAHPFILTFAGGGFMLPSSFGTNMYLETGLHSRNICFSDMDGDGKPDLIIVNTSDNSVSIYKNESQPESPAFAQRVNFPTAISPSSVVAGDLNGDGRPDLVITNSAGGSSSMSTYLNASANGVIALGKRQEYWTGNTDYSYPTHSCIMDFDQDGRPDVAVANHDNTVTVFRSTSDFLNIYLRPGIHFSTPFMAQSIVAGDFDGDRKPDIAVVGNNSAFILKNNSTPTQIAFVAAASLTAGANAYSVAVGDLDNDNKLDIAVANTDDENVSVFKNSSSPGSISFGARQDFEAGGYARWVTFSDLDGDGKTDLAVATSHAGIQILRNTTGQGAISFEPAVQFLTGQSDTRSVAIADVDGDGIPDLAAANNSSGTISVTRNRVKAAHVTSFFPVYGGAGSVISIKGYNLNNVTAVSFGDKAATSYAIVSDNLLQAVVPAGNSGNVVATAPAGNGTRPGFAYATLPLVHHFAPLSGAPGTEITITGANFNTSPANNFVYFGSVRATVVSATANQLKVIASAGADHKPLSVTNGGLTAYANRPFYMTYPGAAPRFHAGSFAGRQDITIPAPGLLHAADLNADGKPDLIATDWYGDKIIIFPNTSHPGKASVGTKIELAIEKYPGGVQACDFDGDGKPDLIAVGERVAICRNTGTGANIAFSISPVMPLPYAIRSYVIGDLDNDGKPDIAGLTEGGLVVLKNTSSAGSISFDLKELAAIDNTPRGITACDFNKDGKVDLAVSKSSEGVIAVFSNISSVGNISFANELLFTAGNGPIEGITVAAVDSDTEPDIVVNTYNSNSFSVLKNISGESIAFESFASFGTGVRPYLIPVSDLDGDGKPDVVVLNQNINVPSTFSLIKNSSDQSVGFQPKFDFPGIEGINNLCVADFDVDGKPDLIASFLQANLISVFRNKSNEARIVPSGANPVSGDVVSTVTIDPAGQLYNGQPYVQRHYNIAPANAATATATITLYFTQQEFDNFNAHPAHDADLPKNSADNAGIANLRIYKYQGFSATGLPGSFDGGGTEINPDDAQVIWNANAQWWEVTFPVNGFSHFFVSSVGFKYQQAAGPAISADGATTICDGTSVMLRAASGAGFQWYKNGIAIANATASTFVATTVGNYTATITVNGVISLPSTVVAIQVKPAPAKPVITANGPELVSSATSDNQWYYEGAIIAGATAQSFRPQQSGNYTVVVTANDCKSEASNKFNYTYTGIINIGNGQYIRLSPNPVAGVLYVHFNLSGVAKLTIQITDAHGKVCGTFNNLPNGQQVDLSHYASGVYFANISISGKKGYVMKLMKL